MILVDTSIWVDHLRHGLATLSELLDRGEILSHPLVTGELAMGRLRQRDAILNSLHKLPRAVVASNEEVLAFVDRLQLFGLGIGYVDAHLLASVRLTPDALLWTRDKRLAAVGGELSLMAKPGE